VGGVTFTSGHVFLPAQAHTTCGSGSMLSCFSVGCGSFLLFHCSLAQVPGTSDWPGLQLHSHNYRGPNQFQGMAKVLVVGASFSGVHSQCGHQTWFCFTTPSSVIIQSALPGRQGWG